MRAQRRGRFCAAALAGMRRSGRRSRLRLTSSSAKGTGWGVYAHRGLGPGWMAVQRCRCRGPAAETGRRSWRGLMQGFLGLLGSTDRLVVFLRRCHGGQGGPGIAGGEESQGRSISPAAVLGAILALHGSRSRVVNLGSFLVARRSYCRAWPGLGRSGAAHPWWSRKLRAAEANGSGLGFGAAAIG
jgi:hypothetical protein